MNLGIIGYGAIGRYVRKEAVERGHVVRALLVRPERVKNRFARFPGTVLEDKVHNLPDDIEHMIDCAGHSALCTFGADILQRGTDLTTVSLGALADQALLEELDNAAKRGHARLHLASGAIGALDCLRAARVGGLHRVIYTGRKPPQGWKGSPAQTALDLDNLKDEARTHFDGSARDAATNYPKNANVAAAVALAGIGFDDTQVQLIADPRISENIHAIYAEGEFGSFSFEIRGRALPDNPRSSALAAMSVISALEQQSSTILF